MTRVSSVLTLHSCGGREVILFSDRSSVRKLFRPQRDGLTSLSRFPFIFNVCKCFRFSILFGKIDILFLSKFRTCKQVIFPISVGKTLISLLWRSKTLTVLISIHFPPLSDPSQLSPRKTASLLRILLRENTRGGISSSSHFDKSIVGSGLSCAKYSWWSIRFLHASLCFLKREAMPCLSPDGVDGLWLEELVSTESESDPSPEALLTLREWPGLCLPVVCFPAFCPINKPCNLRNQQSGSFMWG